MDRICVGGAGSGAGSGSNDVGPFAGIRGAAPFVFAAPVPSATAASVAAAAQARALAASASPDEDNDNEDGAGAGSGAGSGSGSGAGAGAGGSWIQCAASECLKWRRLDLEPEDLLALKQRPWYCYSNPDPHFAQCSVPEQKRP
jgi:hypothetical protein